MSHIPVDKEMKNEGRTFYQVEGKIRKWVYLSFFILLIVHVYAMSDTPGAFSEAGKFKINANIFLPLFIGITAFVILRATTNLQFFSEKLASHLQPFNQEVHESKSEPPLDKYYESQIQDPKGFIYSGLIGTFICILTCVGLGIKAGGLLKIIEIFEYSLLGFLFGIAWWGVIWVILVIRKYKSRIQLDHFDSDNCGGTNFIGNYLSKFASYLWITGLLTVVYLCLQTWTSGLDFWVAFKATLTLKDPSEHVWPTIITFIALLVPLPIFFIPIYFVHRQIIRYKFKTSAFYREKIRTLSQEIDLSKNLEITQNLREQFETNSHLDQMLGRMNNWPFTNKNSLATKGLFFASTSIINLLPKLIALIQKA